ncbi:hypothetical protein ACIQKB_36950 [Streptomyces sp. NPDC092046]|uniref:hypothetical protein n=1 Tax=Streptomyces sp. NPDC092046 TaxID=3366009 RepID=UPI003808E123
MPINPDTVPAQPVYTVTLTATGAFIDGDPVPGASPDPDASRRAALAELYVKAALHGRPVRFLAKEADGTTWPMIMGTDGSVLTLHAPHPNPAPAPGPAQESASVPSAVVATSPTAAASTPAPAAPRPAAGDWSAPLPPEYQPLYADLLAAESAGDLATATTLAAKLEDELTARFGPLHPRPVNLLTLRASLTLRQRTDWYETVEILVHTALRRREAGAEPEQDTVAAVRNAHAAWRALAREDVEGAAELAGLVAGMLEQFGDTARTRDVLSWSESNAPGTPG